MMTVFWINLTIVFLFSLLARCTRLPAKLGPNESRPGIPRPNKLFSFVALASLVLVSGLRLNIGDTFVYRASYTLLGTNLDKALSSTDFGFNVFIVFLNKISSDPQLLIFVTALITNALIVWVIYKYADPFELGTFLYITTGCYLVTMNGLRQFLVSAVIFSAIKWLIDGNWKAYFTLILFVSTLHLSALIMIPVYFIVRQKAWSKATVITLLLTILILVFFKPVIASVFDLMGDNQYAGYREDLAKADAGASYIRIFISAVPATLAYWGRAKLREFWANSDYIVNMSLINTIVMIFSGYNWIFARLSIYFELYNFLLLPWIIRYVFRREMRSLMYFSLLACYFIFYYYENVIALRIIYKSVYLNF